jgi:hypothetical protein
MEAGTWTAPTTLGALRGRVRGCRPESAVARGVHPHLRAGDSDGAHAGGAARSGANVLMDAGGRLMHTDLRYLDVMAAPAVSARPSSRVIDPTAHDWPHQPDSLDFGVAA